MRKPYIEVRTREELSKLFRTSPRDAKKIAMRVDLAIAIRRMVEKKNLTHAQAAKETGVGRTVITAIMNGNLKKITTDRLMNVAWGLGIKMELKIAS